MIPFNLSTEYFGNVSNNLISERFILIPVALGSERKFSNESLIQFTMVLVSSSLFLLSLLKHTISYKERTHNVIKHGNTNISIRKRGDIPFKSSFNLPFNFPVVVEGLHIVFQLKREGIKILDRWAKDVQKFKMFELAIATDKVIMVLDPTIVQKILTLNDARVLNKPKFLYDLIFVEWLRDGLVSSNVETWESHRKMLKRAFYYKNLQYYLKLMNKHGRNLILDLTSGCSVNDSIQGLPLQHSMYFHVIKIISEIIMGENTASDKNNEKFHRHFEQWKSLIVYKLLNPQNMFPLVWWLNPKKKEYDTHVRELERYMKIGIEKCRQKVQLENEINLREANKTDKETEHLDSSEKDFSCLIEEMLHHNASEKEIYDEVATFLTAGHETIIVAMKFFMQHLAEHPEIQIICQQELDAIFESKASSFIDNSSNEDFTMGEIANLKYLDRCILETMRLTATVPLIFRQTTGPITIDELHFDKGTTFGIPIYLLHRDSRYYPNPEKFDPDRFLPQNVSKTFLPFSFGSRNCLGTKLAIMEMKVILGNILRHFDIHTTDKSDMGMQ